MPRYVIHEIHNICEIHDELIWTIHREMYDIHSKKYKYMYIYTCICIYIYVYIMYYIIDDNIINDFISTIIYK